MLYFSGISTIVFFGLRKIVYLTILKVLKWSIHCFFIQKLLIFVINLFINSRTKISKVSTYIYLFVSIFIKKRLTIRGILLYIDMSLTNKKVIKGKNNYLKTKWILNDELAKILFLSNSQMLSKNCIIKYLFVSIPRKLV